MSCKTLHHYFKKKSISSNDLCAISAHIEQKDRYIKRCLYDTHNKPAGYELISNEKIFHGGKNSKTAGRGTRVADGYTPIGFDNEHLASLKGRFAVCAGLADGIRIQQALGIPTACAIGEGNIVGISEQIRGANPHLNLILVADNDNAGRRVLDRAPVFAAVRTVSSAKDASDVFQASGIEKLQSELSESQTVPPVYDFMPKSQAHINNCSMSQAYARLGKAKTPADAAKIAFLIMAKEAVKSPHLKSLRDVQDYLYKESKPFQINWETLESFRVFFERQINARKRAVLRQVVLSDSVKSRHDIEIVSTGYTLSKSDFKYHSVVALGWGMGSGKTQRGGKPFAEMAATESEGFLSTCHRKALIDELCSRLSTPEAPVIHYNNLVREIIDIVKGAAICLPSVTKESLRQVIKKARYVFIDELDQTIKFLSSTEICRTQDGDARAVHDTLRTILSDADKILVADAHLSDLSVRFLESCREGEKFKILEMGYCSDLNVEFMADEKSASYGKLASMLMGGGKLWVGCESRDRASELHNFIKRIKKNFKIICITAENTGDKEQRAFLSNPEQESLKYDCVIHSPIISSGISIQHTTPHFTHGFIFGSGSSIKCTDAAQMMRRVRYIKDFTVCIGLNNRKDIDNWEALSMGLEKAIKLEGRSLMISDYDDLVHDISVSDAILKNDFGAGLFWLLEHDGAKINHARDCKRVQQKILDEIKDTTEAELIAGILDAEEINEDTRGLIESQETRTTEESFQLMKSRLRDDLGLEFKVAEDTIERWERGRITSKLKKFNSAFMRAFEAVDDSKKSDLSLCSLRKARAVAYNQIFEGFDIASPAFYLCNANAETMLKRIIKDRYMYSSLKIVSYKYAEYIHPYKVDRRGHDKIGRDGKPIKNDKTFKAPSNPKSEIKKIIESMGLRFNPRTKRKSLNEHVWTINQDSIKEMYWLNVQRNLKRKVETI